MADEVPELWWSPSRGVIRTLSVGGYHYFGGGADFYQGWFTDLPEDAVRLTASPDDDYEWGCGSTLDEIFSFDEATAREQAKSTGTLRKRRKAGPWQEVTA